MSEIPTSISKRVFWRYVNQKINRLVNHLHVASVIAILFEEMLIDLKNGKEIKIYNLGTLSLPKMKPREYYDVRFQRVMHSEGRHVLRFTLAPVIHKKLRALLDLDRTFKDD
jgi:nucleoid DNA-binding protein